ncbi:MAG: InlB B-repeat-containing protein [Clostridiales bacterium]|nr:InlB B-repeat-containing protein [Clostridiales bacterium]
MKRICFKNQKATMKQLFGVVLALALLFSLIPLSALADEIIPDEASLQVEADSEEPVADDTDFDDMDDFNSEAEDSNDDQYLTEEGDEEFLEHEPESAGQIAHSAAASDVSTETELRMAVSNAPTGEPVTINLTNSITLTGEPLSISPGTDVTLTAGSSEPVDLTGASNQDVISVPGNAKLTIDGIVVTHGGSDVDGGGVSVASGGILTMASGEISGNNNRFSGGGINVNGGTLLMRGGKISENTAGSFGGGIYISSNGLMTMTGGEVTGNTATGQGPSGGGSGGGVYVASGTFTMESGSIKNNATPGAGGGVYNTTFGTFRLKGGEISGNEGSSGGVRNDGSFTLEGGKIKNNHGIYFGGGVYNNGNTDFTMKGGEISGNTAPQGGGVYNVGSSTFRMEGGKITGNEVAQAGNSEVAQVGGGVYNGGNSEFVMSGGMISGNKAAESGGGVINNGKFEMKAGTEGSKPAILDNIVISTTSYSHGGGVYNTGNAEFYMSDGTISGNKAIQGGGVHNFRTGANYNAKFVMSGGEISGNEANIGGGVYSNDSFTMVLGKIANNNANIGGGGIYNSRPSPSIEAVFTMLGGEVCGNTAINGGGLFNSGSASVHAGKFDNNTATNDGGGIWNAYGELNLLSVGAPAEFSNNSARKAYNRNPADDSLYAEQISCTRWTAPLTQGYNNYDISYEYESEVRIVTVTFDGNGGTVAPENASRSLPAGTSLGTDMPGNPAWNDHVFEGWNTEPDGSGTPFASATVVNSDITVFAQWRTETTEPEDYDIIYVLNGGTNAPGNPVSYNDDSDFPIGIANPERFGYDFTGWTVEYANPDLDDITVQTLNYSIPAGSSGDITLTAHWSAIVVDPEDYDIVYVLNGGTNAPGNPVSYNDDSDFPIGITNPERLGYNFTGWTVEYANPDLDDITVQTLSYSIPAGSSGNITLTAHWSAIVEPDIYNIYYVLGGGTNAPGNPTSYSVNSSFPISIGNPTRTGYSFTGWTVAFANAEFVNITTLTKNYSIPAGTTGNITLTAHWNSNGGSNYKPSNPKDPSSPNYPAVNIPSDPPPLVELPPWDSSWDLPPINIGSEYIPLVDIPRTGFVSMAFVFMLLVASLIAMLAARSRRKPVS